MSSEISANSTKSLPDLKSCLYFLLCFSLSLIGIGFAYYALLNDDVSGLFIMDEQILNGKRLYADILDPQFPLIDYFTMIPLAIHYVSGIPIPETFFLFAFLLLQGCVLFSWHIAQRHPLCKTAREAYIILLGLYFALFIIPLRGEGHFTNFGQREHLFCALILPYIMLAINRIGSNEGSRKEQIAAGILGMIGFGIKPQFLLIFGLTELFLMIIRRRFFTWNRPDTLIIIILSLLYYAWFVLFMPEYFALIPKFIYGYKGYQSSWSSILLFVGMTVSLPVVLTWSKRASPHFLVFLFLLLLTVGGECMFAVPKLPYYYHLFPALFFSTLLFIFFALVSQSVWKMLIILFLFNLYTNFTSPTKYYARTVTDKRNEVLTEAGILSAYKTIDFFDADHATYFPLVLYADDSWGLSVISLNYLRSVYPIRNPAKVEFSYHSLEEMGEIERFFYERIIKDLQQHLPDAIVIKQVSVFDYLHYFMLDPRFRDIFAHYELVAYFGYDAIYRKKN